MPQLRQRRGPAPALNSSYVSLALALALALVPKWRVDALPNWRRVAQRCRRLRASVQITLNHALTMSTGPTDPAVVELSCLGQDQFGSNPLFQSAESCPAFQPDNVLYIRWDICALLRSARLANEFLFGSDKSECSQSSRHSHWLFMWWFKQRFVAFPTLISGSPIIT